MTPSVTVNGIACIPAALQVLTAQEIRDAYCRTTKKVMLRMPKAQALTMLRAEGFKRAANPGTGTVLLKE